MAQKNTCQDRTLTNRLDQFVFHKMCCCGTEHFVLYENYEIKYIKHQYINVFGQVTIGFLYIRFIYQNKNTQQECSGLTRKSLCGVSGCGRRTCPLYAGLHLVYVSKHFVCKFVILEMNFLTCFALIPVDTLPWICLLFYTRKKVAK